MDEKFRPSHHCKHKDWLSATQLRMRLPDPVTVTSAAAVGLMASHLYCLDSTYPAGCRHLFLPRRSTRSSDRRVYSAPLNPTARMMSVRTFRNLLRQCSVQCWGLFASAAAEYGTRHPQSEGRSDRAHAQAWRPGGAPPATGTMDAPAIWARVLAALPARAVRYPPVHLARATGNQGKFKYIHSFFY